MHNSPDCNLLALTGEFTTANGGINQDSVIKQLRSANPNKQLVVLINSPGGDLRQAFSIGRAIEEYVFENKCQEPIAYINQQAQSAASVLSALFDEVYIEREAIYMLHSTSCQLEDNFEPHSAERVLRVLELYNMMISQCYGAKSYHPPRAFNSIIDRREWGSNGQLRVRGQTACELGLADYVVENLDDFFKKVNLKKPSTLNI